MAGYELLNWFGMFATAGTPSEIVDRLNDIVNTALMTPSISDKLIVQGIVPRLMTATEYKSFVASETEKFGKIVRARPILNWPTSRRFRCIMAQDRASTVREGSR